MTVVIPGSLVPRRAARTGGLWVYASLLAALALRLASAPTANLGYLLLAACALAGRAHAIRALAMSFLFTMINPGIAPAASAGAAGRYAVLFAAAVSALVWSDLLSRRPRMQRFTLATVLLGLFLIGHSVLFSPMVDVSVLKALSWTLAMATLVSAWSGLPEAQREALAKELFWFLVAMLAVSLPLALTPAGYLRNGSGLQGVLNHPQAFGPTMALLCAWATTRLFGEARPPWWLLGIAGGSLAAILMSEARTSGLAMVAGVGLAVLLGPGFAGRPAGRMLPGLRSARVWAVLGMVLVGGVVMAPKIAEVVQHYITKSGRAQVGGLAEAYERSRGGLMERMRINIAEHPLTGIGFGIASEPSMMNVSRDPVLGLPVGASIEKGVVPLMVLEELGIFGAALVAFWILRLLRGCARGGVAPFAVCATVLLLNMGESTLFSPGGLGLLQLIVLGWAWTSGQNGRTRAHG